jgi:hypothetical protein
MFLINRKKYYDQSQCWQLLAETQKPNIFLRGNHFLWQNKVVGKYRVASMTIDHDSAFKLLLTTFFVEFVDLFCSDLRHQIVPESVEFLPQEVFLDPSTAIQTEDSNQAEKQKRILDIAAKVRIRSDSPVPSRPTQSTELARLCQQPKSSCRCSDGQDEHRFC